MTPFVASFLFVVLAEMGDKTQLLAMAFATRFPAKTVLAGVLAATLVNHLLAVVLGSFLTDFIPMNAVLIAASASFILFGLWTLRGDELEGEDRRYRFSPFWTVAVAFFFAEMGDKTQLATVALAAKYQSILPVWMGTTTAMLVADAFGITVGVILGKKIPERFVKWFAALIFVLFGIIGLYDALPEAFLTVPVIFAAFLVVLVLILLVVRRSRQRKVPQDGGTDGKGEA
ncbi:MAG: TMEM165/GDT1 family protein [Deltaproteobacteria bacterium]|nr:TMEM165/GDT1 family protein [Deltaproteobacteria bacterium]